MPDTDGDGPKRSRFKAYPPGTFHADIAEIRTAEGRLYLFVAIDCTTKFAFVELHEWATHRVPVAARAGAEMSDRSLGRRLPRRTTWMVLTLGGGWPVSGLDPAVWSR